MPTSSTGFIEYCVTGISESLAVQIGMRFVKRLAADDNACGMDARIADGPSSFLADVDDAARLFICLHKAASDPDLSQRPFQG